MKIYQGIKKQENITRNLRISNLRDTHEYK